MEFDFGITALILTLVTILAVFATVQGACAYLTLLERKIAAWTQDRIGPNRVGPLGLLQPIADGLKFFLKEDVIPRNVDKLFYLVAPAIAICTASIAFAVVPFGRTTAPPDRPWPEQVANGKVIDVPDATFDADLERYNRRYHSLDSFQFVIAPNVDVGFVFVSAVGSLAVYAVILGGWSSNNKFSFLGSLRSSAQIISYEIPLGMSVLGVALLTGSLNLERIIDYQYHGGWNVWFQPLAFLLLLVSVFAECNRLPFDLPEAEQELVGGYHTEYSSMKLALFLLSEYVHMITVSFLTVALFWGGWMDPFGLLTPQTTGTLDAVLKLLVFGAKTFVLILFFMLVRWTIPRFRFDQLMGLTWKVIIPLAIANLVCVLIVKHLVVTGKLSVYGQWVLLPASSVVLLVIAAYFALAQSRAPAPR